MDRVVEPCQKERQLPCLSLRSRRLRFLISLQCRTGSSTRRLAALPFFSKKQAAIAEAHYKACVSLTLYITPNTHLLTQHTPLFLPGMSIHILKFGITTVANMFLHCLYGTFPHLRGLPDKRLSYTAICSDHFSQLALQCSNGCATFCLSLGSIDILFSHSKFFTVSSIWTVNVPDNTDTL